MDNVDVSKCKKCEGLEVRKQSGTFDGTNKRYVDGEGRLWNGRTCPKCHKLKVKDQVKLKRANANTGNDAENRDV